MHLCHIPPHLLPYCVFMIMFVSVSSGDPGFLSAGDHSPEHLSLRVLKAWLVAYVLVVFIMSLYASYLGLSHLSHRRTFNFIFQFGLIWFSDHGVFPFCCGNLNQGHDFVILKLTTTTTKMY